MSDLPMPPPPSYEAVTAGQPNRPPYPIDIQPSAPSFDNQPITTGPIIGWNANWQTDGALTTASPMLEQQRPEHRIVYEGAIHKSIGENSKLYFQLSIGLICFIAIIMMFIMMHTSANRPWNA